MTTDSDSLAIALSDRYRLEGELGQGGMANVYLAHDVRHDRKVALKVLKPELAAVLGADRFVQEIKTTAALQHPHILPLFDSGTAGGFLYYVMPYIQGETLRAKLDRETQLGVDEAVRIAREVADALDYAHRHGVVHRDIKPENILLHDGRPLVADFGIALAVSAAAGGRMTETGLSLGTPHYMSPEQATAEKEITGRSDVYSLGCVLYEMLSGNPPHTGAMVQQIIAKIIAEPAEPVTKYRRAVPRNVAAAVGKAIEKLPADRFETAREFAQALANPSFDTESVTGRSGARGGIARAAGRGWPWGIAATGVLAAVWGWSRTNPRPPTSRLSIVLPDSAALEAGASSSIVLSPDGKQLVYIGRGPIGGETRLWIRSLDALEPEPLEGTEGVSGHAISPDGQRIAFVAGNPRALKVLALSGGVPEVISDSLATNGAMVWGTDGFVYMAGDAAGAPIIRVPETGGRAERAEPDPAGSVVHLPLATLPGRNILIRAATQGDLGTRSGALSMSIGVLDLKGGKFRPLVQGLHGIYAPSGHLLYVTPTRALVGVAFDLSRLEIVGQPITIAEGISVGRNGRVDLSLAPNGTLAYRRGGTDIVGGIREFVWVTRAGVATPVDPDWTGDFPSPASFSPDGKSMVATRSGPGGGQEIWIKKLDRGPAFKLLASDAVDPAWSPDGKTIAFGTDEGIWLLAADGSSRAQLRVRTPWTPHRFHFTPDGRSILFDSDADVFAVAVAGDTTLRQLVATPSNDRAPRLSPDGRWLSFSSSLGFAREVWVRDFRESDAAPIQVSTNGGYSQRWSWNGRELYYVDPRTNVLIAVPVESGPRLRLGTPAPLFNTAAFTGLFVGVPSFNPAPDGRFLFRRVVGGRERPAPDELVVVQGFLDDLKTRTSP